MNDSTFELNMSMNALIILTLIIRMQNSMTNYVKAVVPEIACRKYSYNLCCFHRLRGTFTR